MSLPENYAQNSELTGCIMMPWFGPKLIFVLVGNKEIEINLSRKSVDSFVKWQIVQLLDL